MNTLRVASALLLAAMPLGQLARAEPAPAAGGKLTVVIVESLDERPGRLARFDRDAAIFTEVFSGRKWPVDVSVERFAANIPDDATQLRVFPKGIYSETPGDLVYHGWMVLYENGRKHDFGMITYRYYPRASEDEDDTLDRVVRGAAEEVAPKIEKVLFPKGARRAGGRGGP